MGPLLTPSSTIRGCARLEATLPEKRAPFEVPAGRNAETDRVLEGISDGFHPLESERDTSGGVDVSALRTRYFLHITHPAEAKPVLLMDNRLKKQSDRWRDGIAVLESAYAYSWPLATRAAWQSVPA